MLCPRLSQTPKTTGSGSSDKQGRLDIVNLVELPLQDPLPDESVEEFMTRVHTKAKRTQYLLFQFPQPGWASDQYMLRLYKASRATV